MKYRITCVIERDELVGPLVTVLAAHGATLTIEAIRNPNPADVIHDFHPPRKEKAAPKTARAPVRRGKSKPMGRGASIALKALVEGVRQSRAIKEAFEANGLSKQGVGPTLFGLRVNGLARSLGDGEWEPTDKGREHAARTIVGVKTERNNHSESEAPGAGI